MHLTGTGHCQQTTMFSRRTPEAILLTVPYTGTHFTRTLLEVAGAHPYPQGKIYVPHAHWLDANVAADWAKIVQTKVLITARDPYLSAIRCIKTGQENPIDFIADAWDVFFTGMNEMEYFVFDIGLSKEARLGYARNALNFVSTDLYLDRIDDYINRWEPMNESVTEHKTEYLKTGKLPENYDWDKLDNAVEWYNSLTTH